MLAAGAALHPALGGWGGGARGMGDVAPHDFTAAQMQLLSGSFTNSVLAGWPGAGSGADQVMQLLLQSHGGAQAPWAAQQAAAAQGAAAHPYAFHGTGAGAIPAGLLHPTAYSQLPAAAAAPGAWQMSELFAPMGPPPALDDGGAAGGPPPSNERRDA